MISIHTHTNQLQTHTHTHTHTHTNTTHTRTHALTEVLEALALELIELHIGARGLVSQYREPISIGFPLKRGHRLLELQMLL